MTAAHGWSSINLETLQPTARFAGVFVLQNMKNILFIDGRNFLSKMEFVLNSYNDKKKEIDFSKYNFSGLFDKAITDVKVDRKIIYMSSLSIHKDTKEKSEALIIKQRNLQNSLRRQGFEVVISGRVRGHMEKCPKGHETLTFREKGVDVRMAVDMVSMACDKELKTAIIGSSDSDLQPAIKELQKRGIERIYLGFENQPNKGLAFTTNRTILIRNSEVGEFAKGNM